MQPAKDIAPPLRDLTNLVCELARWIKITTPNDRPATILRDEMVTQEAENPCLLNLVLLGGPETSSSISNFESDHAARSEPV